MIVRFIRVETGRARLYSFGPVPCQVLSAPGLAQTNPQLTTSFGDFHGKRKPLNFAPDNLAVTYEIDRQTDKSMKRWPASPCALPCLAKPSAPGCFVVASFHSQQEIRRLRSARASFWIRKILNDVRSAPTLRITTQAPRPQSMRFVVSRTWKKLRVPLIA